jgi:uncharacterized protein YecE (DUF72 family)
MNLHVGTSGFSFKEWKGTFYPEDLPADAMLRYYGERLATVEINNTFYRLPKESMLAGWAEEVPPTFRFAVKASRRITHIKRLREADSETEYLLRVVRSLGERLGPVLFQLPPNLKLDLPRLQAFLGLLPRDVRAAFEFRHETWFVPEVFSALRQHGAALAVDDSEDLAPACLIEPTADWGYLRLRRQDYATADLISWARKIAASPWTDAFVFFKHEDAGIGPRLAAEMESLWNAAPGD